jgi:hypothetical protein
MLLFWYPFDFRTDGVFIRERMGFLGRVPFEVYYYGTEYRAITEVFHKVLFFAPLGALLAWFVVGLPWLWRGYVAAASIFAILATALCIELGQVLLPGKLPDITDWFLEGLGGCLGYILVRNIRARMQPRPRGPAFWYRLPGETIPYAGKLPFFWRDITKGVSLLAMLGLAATYVPGIPYNVRELIYQGSPLLSALLLSLFWFWLAGMPVFFAQGLAASRLFCSLYLPATLLHAVVAALMVTTAVPSESIHDLVGSPILGWPGQIEVLARLTALFAALSLLLTGGAWMARAAVARRRDAGIWAWGGSAMILLTLAHWVVVERAATDNLTELMAGGGGIQASVALTACVLLLVTCASLLGLSAMGVGLSRFTTLIWVALTLPLSYGLLSLGMESNVLKYGQSFSALQFLLSADRAHLASGAELVMRYGLASCVGLLALAFAQWPFFRFVAATSAREGYGFGR